ncbi:hypothetical protein ACIPSE_45155 [Streptomyces sp. NPDC090106]|uniref:hypothetical protein n=1 Tax=Streptomyces sp. NPDC090106 TaxID=3365946 RepID=UPI0038009188
MIIRGEARDAVTALRFTLTRVALCILACVVASGGAVILRNVRPDPLVYSPLFALCVVVVVCALLCGLVYGGWFLVVLATALIHGSLTLARLRGKTRGNLAASEQGAAPKR